MPRRTGLRKRSSKKLGPRLRLIRRRTKKRVRLFFQDEARIGQKGRTCHVWWRRSERPRGLADKRFAFAYIFACVEPGTDNAFALVMPHVHTEAMQLNRITAAPIMAAMREAMNARVRCPDSSNAG